MDGWMDGGMDVVSHGHTLFRGTGCGHVRLGWVGEWMDGKMETNRANRKMERTGEPREEEKGEQMEREITKNVGKYYICFLMHSRDCPHHRFITPENCSKHLHVH